MGEEIKENSTKNPYWSDGYVLYFNCGGGCITVCICQNS